MGRPLAKPLEVVLVLTKEDTSGGVTLWSYIYAAVPGPCGHFIMIDQPISTKKKKEDSTKNVINKVTDWSCMIHMQCKKKKVDDDSSGV